MESAKVYFSDLRTDEISTLEKLRRLMKAAGFEQIDFKDKYVAVKLHFGEPGNMAYLRPNWARVVCDYVRALGGKPFLTDCNTLYVGGRANALDHLDSAMLNGYSPMTTGAQCIIADGLKGDDYDLVPIRGGKYLRAAKIGRAIMDADIFISLTHAKGHVSAGFGGAPVGVRVRGGKVVMRVVMRVRDDAVGVHGLGVDLVGAGGIERHGIERREHTHVRHDRHIAVVVAVAAGRHVECERDVERRTPVDDRLGILGDLAVEQLVCDRIVRVDGVHRADVDAAAAAGALILQDGALAVFDVRTVVRAVFDALAAADALVGIDDRLAGAVHLLLAGA